MKKQNNNDDDASRCAFQEEFAAQVPPAQTPTKKAQPPLAQKLLDCSKPTVSTRDILIYGPSSLRDRRKAIIAAEILAVHGWLIPLKTPRYDMHKWQVVRKPTVFPTVAAETADLSP